MASLTELRRVAREHAQQLAAVKYLTVQDLADRWGVSDDTVRAIPREQLPYILLGRSRFRRYDPRDIETFERTGKHGGSQEPAA